MVEDRKSSAHGQNDAIDPGCVKTCTSQGCPELFSHLPSSDRSCQCNWFPHRRNRDGNSTRKLGVRVFTQPGSDSDVSEFTSEVCFAPMNGRHEPRKLGQSANTGSRS